MESSRFRNGFCDFIEANKLEGRIRVIRSNLHESFRIFDSHFNFCFTSSGLGAVAFCLGFCTTFESGDTFIRSKMDGGSNPFDFCLCGGAVL